MPPRRPKLIPGFTDAGVGIHGAALMEARSGPQVLVIGAGVVGMACARALQGAGLSVCVIDRDAPGEGCSYGNAGVIAVEHVLPLARPATLVRLPRMLLGAASPLYLKPERMPALAGWFARFVAACRPDRVERGTRAIAALTRRSLTAWETVLAGSGARHLLQQRGLYEVYEDARAQAAARRGAALAGSFGVRVESLDGAALRAREPALSARLAGALYFPEVAHVLDPRGVVTALARAFSEAGGCLRRDSVRSLASAADGVAVVTDSATLSAERVVIAAGLGARALCRTLGYDPPLVAEMGYHVTFPEARARVSAPVASAADGFIATPMADALRVAGTVEFAREEAPADWRRAAALASRAARLFRDPLGAPAARWRGSRPTLPDFLPAIGFLPGQRRVFAAFGHQHIGLTTAAVTAEIVRDLLLGRPAAVDVEPYAPARFRG